MNALLKMHDIFGESVFTDPKKFKAGLADVLSGSENEPIRNLLNIAISEMNAYHRLMNASSLDRPFALQSLVHETNRNFLIPTDASQVLFECIAELLAYPTTDYDYNGKQLHKITQNEYIEPSADSLLSKAKRGDTQSLLEIARTLLKSRSSDDVKKAQQIMSTLASKDCKEASDAQFYLGCLFIEGLYVHDETAIGHPNLEKADFWWRQASNNEHIGATSNLSELLRMENVYHKANPDDGVQLLKELVYKHKSPEAMLDLGYLFCTGKYVPQDTDAGLKLIDEGLAEFDDKVPTKWCYLIGSLFLEVKETDRVKQLYRHRKAIELLERYAGHEQGLKKLRKEAGDEVADLIQGMLDNAKKQNPQ